MFIYVQECHACHPICNGCIGPTSGHCTGCTAYWEESNCVELCPSDHYTDELAKRCVMCHAECEACHGPMASNCTLCHHMKLYDDLEDRSPDAPVSDVTAVACITVTLACLLTCVAAAKIILMLLVWQVPAKLQNLLYATGFPCLLKSPDFFS